MRVLFRSEVTGLNLLLASSVSTDRSCRVSIISVFSSAPFGKPCGFKLWAFNWFSKYSNFAAAHTPCFWSCCVESCKAIPNSEAESADCATYLIDDFSSCIWVVIGLIKAAIFSKSVDSIFSKHPLNSAHRSVRSEEEASLSAGTILAVAGK